MRFIQISVIAVLVAFLVYLQIIANQTVVNEKLSNDFSVAWGDKLKHYNVSSFSICAGYSGSFFTMFKEVQHTIYVQEGGWCLFPDEQPLEIKVTKKEFEIFSNTEITLTNEGVYNIKLDPKVKDNFTLLETLQFLDYPTKAFIAKKEEGVKIKKSWVERKAEIIDSWGTTN